MIINIKRIISILLCMAFVILPTNYHAEAETLGDLEDALAALKSQKATNEANIAETEEEIAAKQTAIQNAQEEQTNAQIEYNEAAEKIEESNTKIEELTAESEKLLQFLQQMQSQNAYLEYITGATSTTEMIMRIAAVQQITQYNQETLEELERLIEENKQLQIELEQKQEDLQVKIENYRTTITSLVGDLEEYDTYTVDIDTQISQAQSTYNTYKTICANNPLTSSQGSSAKLTDCESAVTNSGWLKPLVSGRITSTIGTRWGSYHNALDIGGNAEGTAVYAAAAGTVSGIIWRYWCGGNMLYINVNVNGVKYTTYYYHLLTINVSVGDVVSTSTIIGTVGGGSQTSSYDSCSTGAHLHFGVATGYYTGSISKSNVITPPGFPNTTGYTFTSRYDYYTG